MPLSVRPYCCPGEHGSTVPSFKNGSMVNDGGDLNKRSSGVILLGFTFVAVRLNALFAHMQTSTHRVELAGSLVSGNRSSASKTATAAASLHMSERLFCNAVKFRRVRRR